MNLLFRLGLFFLFLLLQNLHAAQEPIRTWTSSDGRTLEARFIEQVGSNVRIKNEAGREFTLPITRFSQADQEYVVEAAARALFQMPEPFEDRGKGAIIIASANGKVTVIPAPRYSGSQEVKPVARDVIVGEPLPHGSTVMTGANSEATLLLTSGSLVNLGPDSKLVLNAFWQKDFRASAKKVIDLKEETSPSRVAIKLETGDLIVAVKKLNIESSFTIESPLGVSGIRGTQFGLYTNEISTELKVLDGKVSFMDTNQKAKSVETSQKVIGSKVGVGKVNPLAESDEEELIVAVTKSRNSVSEYNLTHLSATVKGFAPKPNYIVKSSLNMELIWCPPGGFIMGDDRNNSASHPVLITKGFFLGKFEVTQEEYEKIMGSNPSNFKANKNPVNCVSWSDAIEFCKALSSRERTLVGWTFSLPTEAEWEYACRAGTRTKYSWGDKISPDLANYPNRASALDKPVEVGSYPPNPWGLHDMHGNILEWCNDWYGDYQKGQVHDPKGPISGLFRVQRGGAFNDSPFNLYSARRFSEIPKKKLFDIGFRVVLKSDN